LRKHKKRLAKIFAIAHKQINKTTALDAPEKKMSVASTILNQISIATKMSCGIRNQMQIKDGLQMRVGSDRGNKKWINVLLCKNDTYKVELIEYSNRKNEVRVLGQCSEVFCGELSAIIHDLVHQN
jgi:hypothetical protein